MDASETATKMVHPRAMMLTRIRGGTVGGGGGAAPSEGPTEGPPPAVAVASSPEAPVELVGNSRGEGGGLLGWPMPPTEDGPSLLPPSPPLAPPVLAAEEEEEVGDEEEDDEDAVAAEGEGVRKKCVVPWASTWIAGLQSHLPSDSLRRMTRRWLPGTSSSSYAPSMSGSCARDGPDGPSSSDADAEEALS